MIHLCDPCSEAGDSYQMHRSYLKADVINIDSLNAAEFLELLVIYAVKYLTNFSVQFFNHDILHTMVKCVIMI